MAQPVKLAEGVWRISTFGASLVNSFAFEEPDGGVTVVDTGVKRIGPRRIVAGLAALGKRPDQVRRILLTHAHFDHAGGAAGVVQRTGAPLAAHDIEAPYLRRGETPHYAGSDLLGRLLNLRPPRLQVVDASSTFLDGDIIDVAGGLRVLHTPGHTPGHCAFLHERSGVLITGDSIFNWRDRMSWSFAYFCTDPDMAQETADRLGEADYEIAAFTHGPEIRDNAREHIRDFLRRKREQR
jgi:glyoxylase-like metal-dependent hydrolase (beta-lactamase superfamily II)